MIILITGASHTGKTLLAQRLLEKYHYPYLSIDHLKMGLIRSGNTHLTPADDDALTGYLWPIVREMIKTAIENRQDLIVEGCYVPFDWRREFEEKYLSDIRFICLAMTEEYIEEHFDEIMGHESDIESRAVATNCTIDGLKKDNAVYIDGFQKAGERVALIDSDYERTLTEILSCAGAAEKSDLQLYVPRPEDGWFYVKMMSDPATMAYNAPWFPPDGCIPEPEAEWQDLQASWIEKAPERFYAFLQRKSDGAFVGDVNYHRAADRDWCDMGIVIYAPERGKGYGTQGLLLLLDRAFRVDGVSRLHNEFETAREAAYHIHRTVGFRETGSVDGIIQLELTREEYLRGGDAERDEED